MQSLPVIYKILGRLMMKKISRLLGLLVLVLSAALIAFAQESPKRNDRPQESGTPAVTPQRRDDKKPPDATTYSYEFSQKDFIVNHIVITHDALGRGQVTFERRGEPAA
ncbi:MAG: hypothetical protein ACXW3C_18770, partial [Pyrinomonadaceae bacterium]